MVISRISPGLAQRCKILTQVCNPDLADLWDDQAICQDWVRDTRHDWVKTSINSFARATCHDCAAQNYTIFSLQISSH